jgi:hypothetical protein
LNNAYNPIVIRGYAVRPRGAAQVPAVVSSHGYGEQAALPPLVDTAVLLGSMMISYSGPGQGTMPDNMSEGLGLNANMNTRLFDTVPDKRGSWLWGHTVAALRALTCLEARPDVDPARLGMTGYSIGAVATLVASGVDSRIVASVSRAGSLALDTMLASEDNWIWSQVQGARLDLTSPELQGFIELLDPAQLATAPAKVFMANGSTDEFFPVTAFSETFRSIGNADSRATLSANFDHGGCFARTGIESMNAISQRMGVHLRLGMRMWFGYWFGTDPSYTVIPEMPIATFTPMASMTGVVATIDEGDADVQVEDVTMWWSTDHSIFYESAPLTRLGAGMWGGTGAFTMGADTIAFVDVNYTTTGNQRFALSSIPDLSQGYVPRIRQQGTCEPPP